MKRTAAAIACSILAGCGKVASPALPPDAGPSQPTVEDVDPAPGAIAASARFTVRFSAAMDEGQLLAPSGRSESVVLAAEAVVTKSKRTADARRNARKKRIRTTVRMLSTQGSRPCARKP